MSIVISAKEEETPFYNASEAVRGLFDRLGLEPKFKKAEHSHLTHKGRFAHILIENKIIGFVGELHPATQENLGIPHRVGIVEIALDALIPLLKDKSSYKPIPQYPSTSRDIAFLVDKNIEHAQIAEKLTNLDQLICSVELFDVYKGKKDENKKSMAYRIVYRSYEKTLEAKEVDMAHAKVEQELETKFKAQIRK